MAPIYTSTSVTHHACTSVFSAHATESSLIPSYSVHLAIPSSGGLVSTEGTTHQRIHQLYSNVPAAGMLMMPLHGGVGIHM